MNKFSLDVSRKYFLFLFSLFCLLNTMTYTNNEGRVKSITEWAKAQWKKPVVRYTTYGIITIILGVCLINKILIDLHKGPCTTPFDDPFLKPPSWQPQPDEGDFFEKMEKGVRQYVQDIKDGKIAISTKTAVVNAAVTPIKVRSRRGLIH